MASPWRRSASTAPQIDGVPQDDGGDNQVEAAGAMLLAFIAAVMDPAKAVEADGARQRVPGFALVQLGGGLPTERRVLEPVEDEQRPLDPTDFPKCQGKAVLARIGTQAPQHQ